VPYFAEIHRQHSPNYYMLINPGSFRLKTCNVVLGSLYRLSIIDAVILKQFAVIHNISMVSIPFHGASWTIVYPVAEPWSPID
jgi:hypothetical protein